MGLFVPELCTTNDSEEDEEADAAAETTARRPYDNVKPALPKGIKLKVRMPSSCVRPRYSLFRAVPAALSVGSAYTTNMRRMHCHSSAQKPRSAGTAPAEPKLN